MSAVLPEEIHTVTQTNSSIIVASRNRHQQLEELIDSVINLNPLPYELVIVDDASDKPIEESIQLKESDLRIRIFRNDPNQGPAKARNTGVHRSRGSILLFTDDDCIVHPQWAGILVKRLVTGSPDLGGISGKVIARDTDIFSRYFEFHQILNPKPHDKMNPKRVPYLVTANCAIQKDTFMRAGGFDYNIPIAGGEDVALSLKILKQQLFLEREESAIVHHRFKSGFRNFYHTFFRYGLGGRYVVDRYLPL